MPNTPGPLAVVKVNLPLTFNDICFDSYYSGFELAKEHDDYRSQFFIMNSSSRKTIYKCVNIICRKANDNHFLVTYF